MSNPIWQALEARVGRRPADPVVTFLDAAGQRTELSAKTLANNAAKAANALRDEAFIEAGSRLAFHIPWHWQRSVWTLAAWLVDATVVPSGSPETCDLVIAGPNEAPSILSGQFGPPGAAEVWVVSTHPFGLPNPMLPHGALDAATLARIQPDAFAPDPSSPDADAGGFAALTLASGASSDEQTYHQQTYNQQALLSQAAIFGAFRMLDPGARFAVVGEPPDELQAWLLAALVPIVCDATIVMTPAGVDGEAISLAESARLLD